ncbi:MAG: PaaI family thioesterase [Acidimicrobiales bacterium]
MPEGTPPLSDATPGSPGWAARIRELAQTEPSPRRVALFRVADAIRTVLHRMVQSSAPNEVIEAAAADLEAVADRFNQYTNKSMYEGFAESANAGEPFGFFDHSPMLGRANPLAPPIDLWLEDDHMVGTATFGAAYEGPPGCVHGGYVAAAFDEVLGSTQSLSGSPGMTGRLTVSYRSPTPLETELRFVGRLERVEGRKIFTKGELWAGDRLCAEAEGLFISIREGQFADLKAERDRRQAGREVDQG